MIQSRDPDRSAAIRPEPVTRAIIDEIVFMEAWRGGLLPIVSGLIRVRQFQRANPASIAYYAVLKAADAGRRF